VGMVALIVVFFVFINFMEHIDMVTKDGAPLNLVALYYACYMPRVFVEASWMAFLIAMLLVLGGLARNNEYTAMLAGGVSIYRIGMPIFVIGAMLSVLVFCVQEFVAPSATLRAYDLKDGKFKMQPDERRVSAIAGIGRRNERHYFETLDVEKGLLTGIQIHTQRGGSIIKRIDAQRAVWDESAGRWFLENGAIREFDRDGIVVSHMAFSIVPASFRESPATLRIYASTRGEFNFLELRRQIDNLRADGYNAGRLKLDYHKKFALPLANLIIVLLGLPFVLESRRGGLVLGFALSLAAALAYYGLFQISLALGRGGVVPAVVAAWLANLLFLGVGAGLVARART
jgi:lipopolysaccharide export system permease protein